MIGKFQSILFISLQALNKPAASAGNCFMTDAKRTSPFKFFNILHFYGAILSLYALLYCNWLYICHAVLFMNLLIMNDAMKITIDNIEQHVPFKIWQRGMDCYDGGAVFDLEEVTPGEWEATVEGTMDYQVELSLNGREVESWSCDCPYDYGDILCRKEHGA